MLNTYHGKSIAGNWVFTISRWLGTNPFNKNGILSKFLSIYFIFMAFGFSVAGLAIRIVIFAIQYDDTNADKFTYLLKTVIATVTQFPLVAPGLLHIWQCISKKTRFEDTFSHLHLHGDRIVDLVMLTVHFALHVVHFLTVFYMSRDTFWLVRKIYVVSGFLAGGNFLNMMIILQFSSLLLKLDAHMRALSKDVSSDRVQQSFFHYLKLAHTVNLLYDSQILFTIVQIFTYTVQYLYIIIDGILYREYMICCRILLVYAAVATVLRAVMLYLVTARVNGFYVQVSHIPYQSYFYIQVSQYILCDSYHSHHYNALHVRNYFTLFFAQT